jgi:hypothetical protein
MPTPGGETGLPQAKHSRPKSGPGPRAAPRRRLRRGRFSRTAQGASDETRPARMLVPPCQRQGISIHVFRVLSCRRGPAGVFGGLVGNGFYLVVSGKIIAFSEGAQAFRLMAARLRPALRMEASRRPARS